ncbi:MAG: hypothetical protein KKF79_02720 [Gammaproteobacteria bacterium]|nr:hypothetical protein [Gammaproteobacteria bacterium]
MKLIFAFLKSSFFQYCLVTALYFCCAVTFAGVPGMSVIAETTVPGSGWHLNPAGDYQPLPETEAAKLVVERPGFCVNPRPDGRPVQWTDAAGKAQQLQLGNEAGVLRWWSESMPQRFIWSDGAYLSDVSDQISDQLAVITQPSSKQMTVVWPENRSQRYSAVDLSDPSQPKSLWRWQAPITGSVQTPVSLHLKTTTGSTSALLMVSGTGAVQPALWIVEASSGHLIATQSYPRAAKTVELPFVLQDIAAAAAVLDRNADGYTDRIYLVDQQGRLVQVDINEQLQFQSRVVADLSDSAAEFSMQPVASRALLPDYQQMAATNQPAAAMSPMSKPEDSADAAGTAGQAADIVILYSKKAKQTQLWVLTIPDSPAFTIQPHHLTARDLQTNDINTVPTASITAGWFGTLPEAPVSPPQVLAGVLYVPLAANAESCAGARQATQLFARHLFQGSVVYSTEQLAAIPAPFGATTAVQRSSGDIGLQDMQNGVLLLPQIQSVRADCLFCTEPLLQSHFPKWQRMAIYQHETEIYR